MHVVGAGLLGGDHDRVFPHGDGDTGEGGGVLRVDRYAGHLDYPRVDSKVGGGVLTLVGTDVTLQCCKGITGMRVLAQL